MITTIKQPIKLLGVFGIESTEQKLLALDSTKIDKRFQISNRRLPESSEELFEIFESCLELVNSLRVS